MPAIPLNLFGGLVTELSPPSLPEGVSPDCQDVVFLPGSVGSRPCLQKLFAAAFPGSPTMVYQKTFAQPNEDPLNLFIDSANRLWIEDTGNSPGVATVFETLPYAPGSILQVLSATQFGREYIACSDGMHGAAVPLQFDGTYLDRVSQDGPGAPPSVADQAPATYAIAASPVGLESNPPSTGAILSASENGNICSYVFSASFITVAGVKVPLSQLIQPNDQIEMSNLSVAGYNGTFTVLQVAGNVVECYNPTAGLVPAVPGGGGAVWFLPLVACTLTATPPPTVFPFGVSVVIAGATNAAYDGTYTIRVPFTNPVCFLAGAVNTALANSGGGTLSAPGLISPGQHQLVVLFLTRQGYITAPSPSTNWTSAGNQLASVTGIPIGPSNVVARLLAFTGAGGANYFYIPITLTVPNPFGPPIQILSTVVPDNVSLSATFNFSDTALFGATAIDITGRNYFAQTVLSDCLGVFPFASRMFWWGERNNLRNLLNMGFEGGYAPGALDVPLGWTAGSGGTLVLGGAWAAGMAWQITGQGPTIGAGQISQGAATDTFGVPVTQPSTAYTVRCWVKPAQLNTGGSLVAQFYSNSTSGVLSSATIPLGPLKTVGQYAQANFTLVTPAVIPADLTVTVAGYFTVGQIIVIDELQLIPTLQPYRDSVFRPSYVNAPEQFDSVTGSLGSTSDPSAIRNVFQLRNTMYFHTLEGLQSTTDSGVGEPGTWSVPEVTQSVGSVSVHGTDAGRVGTGESGEQFEFVANEKGVYIFAGGETLKISQEIQAQGQNGMPGWDSINPKAIQTLWVKNDITNRRAYIGIPTGAATAPNIMFVLDYRELNDFYAISSFGPVRQSLQGRMIAQEFCRKWTRWNIAANCGEMLARGGGEPQFCVGAGNGQTPGQANGFGNVYEFSSSKLTDDDYGQVTPYYTTYFFVSRDQEQLFQLGGHRKLASYLSMFVTGVGSTAITPFAAALTNAWPSLPAYPLSTSLNHDLEWGMNVTAERIALKIGSTPLSGQTDNGFTLEHLAMTMKPEPMAPVRGAM